MTVAVCRAMPTFDVVHTRMPMAPPARQLDIWNSIQADKAKAPPAKPYVHPAVRRSMSQESLELCTESLGSETGSHDFLDQDMARLHAPSPADAESDAFPPALEHGGEEEAGELTAVRYHRPRPQRAFPPPLPSMSRRDGPCLQMRPHRRNGRLVMEAVAVRPHGYLHSQRQGGRLKLCFVDCSAREQRTVVRGAEYQERAQELAAMEAEREEEDEVVDDDDDDDEEEEELEVVDRGTVVEVKVSTQAQLAASGKVQRSRLVINKFVGGAPVSDSDHQIPRGVAPQEEAAPAPPASGLRRVPSSTMTLAAAVATASTAMNEEDEEEECFGQEQAETKLLFTSRVGDTQELVQSVRRCRQLRQKPLFIVEPYCIATS